ncbi:hypothetical protein M758_10G176700 [Ceratodon purpureus]|nr:hypothetical protein KC19_10G181300 [Ceratodon purpureus]KAG0604505.1 hypothetical protein M758_10G176700 [Ceratodon purpureus]KAG0604506.1 hypothetical protein M758_10G176700 [Ceratodon purpureus]
MDAADYDFTHIPEFDMKELKLFETDLQQCGKKRAAEGGTDEGVLDVKKAKMGGPVKIGREEAAKYWQSLIDAGRELGIRAEGRKATVKYITSPTVLRSLKVKVKATKSSADNEAFLAAMHAKVNLFSQTKSAPTTENLKFGCTHCDK